MVERYLWCADDGPEEVAKRARIAVHTILARPTSEQASSEGAGTESPAHAAANMVCASLLAAHLFGHHRFVCSLLACTVPRVHQAHRLDSISTAVVCNLQQEHRTRLLQLPTPLTPIVAACGEVLAGIANSDKSHATTAHVYTGKLVQPHTHCMFVCRTGAETLNSQTAQRCCVRCRLPRRPRKLWSARLLRQSTATSPLQCPARATGGCRQTPIWPSINTTTTLRRICILRMLGSLCLHLGSLCMAAQATTLRMATQEPHDMQPHTCRPYISSSSLRMRLEAQFLSCCAAAASPAQSAAHAWLRCMHRHAMHAPVARTPPPSLPIPATRLGVSQSPSPVAASPGDAAH